MYVKQDVIYASFIRFSGIIGLLQSALPYVFAIYSLEYLPPTLLGVFMVSTPWWSALFERIPAIKVTVSYSTYKMSDDDNVILFHC